MVVLYKGKQNYTKLLLDTWSVRKTAVRVKPCKTKLRGGQEKFRERA